jgi:hypothetical protein
VRAALDFEVSRVFGDFDAASDRPGSTMIAYVGELPRRERARLAARMRTIRSMRDAGTLTEAAFYTEAVKLNRKLESFAVGVYLLPPRA